MTAQRLGTWALILGGWTLVGAFLATQARLYFSNAGRSIGGWPAAMMEIVSWSAWAALAVVVLGLAGRWRDSQREAQRAQSQLEMLRARLDPHFLFNTLHAISTLMHRDVEAADRMLADLSDLLRVSLESGSRQQVPLQQELESLEPYLRIEQARFPDRLTVQMRVDPAVLDAQVPNLILQPLVENAIRHGIAARAVGGQVVVFACRDRGRLRLEVRDDGCGLPPEDSDRPREGAGLASTRARLRQLYGGAQSFSLGPAPGGGAVASLEIPFIPAPPDSREWSWEEAGNVSAALRQH